MDVTATSDCELSGARDTREAGFDETHCSLARQRLRFQTMSSLVLRC